MSVASRATRATASDRIAQATSPSQVFEAGAVEGLEDFAERELLAVGGVGATQRMREGVRFAIEH